VYKEAPGFRPGTRLWSTCTTLPRPFVVRVRQVVRVHEHAHLGAHGVAAQVEMESKI